MGLGGYKLGLVEDLCYRFTYRIWFGMGKNWGLFGPGTLPKQVESYLDSPMLWV